MSEVTPQDFDFDKWLDGADRPSRAVKVYQKAGIVADLEVLAERIQNSEADEVDGPSMSGGSGKLRAEYARLTQEFYDSGLTVRVQSLTREEQADIHNRNASADELDAGSCVIAAAITSPKITPAQVRALEKKIGPAQFGRIVTAFNLACSEAPEVSADFLPKRSTQGDGEES